eukprot:gene14541-17643_t
MDVILPYVVWITLLAWLMDWGLKALTRRAFPCVNNVWQRYGDQVVLERLNLHVAEGEFCTLVGTSGCGKSTFLRLLLGQETLPRSALLGRLFGSAKKQAREQAAALLHKVGLGHALDNLGTRLLVFDKVRLDPHAPGAYGARITYDIPLNSERRKAIAAELGATSK